MTNKKIVLIVDDDPTNRAVLAFPFKNHPDTIEVIEASDGAQALALLSSKKANLILLDVHMPNMNGIEFLKKRLQDPELREIPVVMVSTDDAQKREAESYGANDYLVKPISPYKLYELVSPYLV